MFLCERFLAEYDISVRRRKCQRRMSNSTHGAMDGSAYNPLDLSRSLTSVKRQKFSAIQCIEVKENQHLNRRSSAALLGAYKDLERQYVSKSESDRQSIHSIAWEVIQERTFSNNARTLFEHLDKDGGERN